jgi:Protein of unknown function (DUF4245)
VELCCDPRGMTGAGPTEQHPHPTSAEELPPAVTAAQRASRLSAANMLRSLLPLVVIVLLLAGWFSLRQSQDVAPVRAIDPSSTVQLAAARAGYPLVVPTGLPDGYRPTSARTDAGSSAPGAPVTLEIGYLTPGEQFAGFVVSGNPHAEQVTAVLGGAHERGSVELGGQTWTRATTSRGETALSRQDGGATVVVSGSASEQELETVAAAVRPYSG